MPGEIKARELLTLLLDDEEFNSSRGPRTIVGFDQLLEKMDKLCDAITQRGNGEVIDGEYEEVGGDDGGGGHSAEMVALSENLQALRAIMERSSDTPDNTEQRTLLATIAKNTMRGRVPWEFTVERDKRTGFTSKIIAKPMGA